MKIRKVLLLSIVMMFLIGFAGSKETTARNVSEQCRADIVAVAQRCGQECARDLRCFIRCVVTNFPASCSH